MAGTKHGGKVCAFFRIMPILPDSVFNGPPARMSYRRQTSSPTGPEAPLLQTKSRGIIYPLYPLPQNKAHVAPVETFNGGGPPDARVPQRKQFPQNFNTGSHLLFQAASEAGKRPLPPERTDIVSSEADFLHP